MATYILYFNKLSHFTFFVLLPSPGRPAPYGRSDPYARPGPYSGYDRPQYAPRLELFKATFVTRIVFSTPESLPLYDFSSFYSSSGFPSFTPPPLPLFFFPIFYFIILLPAPFVCFVVINPRVLSANRVDLVFLYLFHKYQFCPPPRGYGPPSYPYEQSPYDTRSYDRPAPYRPSSYDRPPRSCGLLAQFLVWASPSFPEHSRLYR